MYGGRVKRIMIRSAQMPTSVLQCPFCEKTSSAPQGLSAHVRNGHPKQYPKWSKDPNRLKAVRAKSQEHHEPEKPKVSIAEPPKTSLQNVQASESHSPAPSDNGALGLLNQARQQLA